MSKIFCQHCGFENTVEHNFCIRCGKELAKQNFPIENGYEAVQGATQTTETKNTQPGNNSEQKPVLQQPIQALHHSGSEKPQQEDVVTEFEMAIPVKTKVTYNNAQVYYSKQIFEIQKFVLDNSDIYADAFQKLENGNPIVFNWAALLFGSFWLLYRKMYLLGAVMLALQTILLMLSLNSFAVGSIILHLILFAVGSRLYFSYVKKHVEHAKLLDERAKQAYFKEKGTTSLSAVALACMVLFIVWTVKILWPLWFQ